MREGMHIPPSSRGMSENPKHTQWSEGRCAQCGSPKEKGHAPGCENRGSGLAERIAKMTGKTSGHAAETATPRNEFDANRALNENVDFNLAQQAINELLPSPLDVRTLSQPVIEAIAAEARALKNSLSIGLGDSEKLRADSTEKVMDIITASKKQRPDAPVIRMPKRPRQPPQEQPPTAAAA